ncbi:MAG: hypothetical protein JW745_00545 [Sedimentisphaerales bacterium]|nr:hypothetical protein [Sedimentisphaerales bacterium]MBN2842399.1 hypothetical protein [Sedimentisphaerales bacterium]
MASTSYGIFYNGQTALGVEINGSGPQLYCNFIEAVANARGCGIEQLREVSRKMSGNKPVALALGGTLYMSHDHRSEFEDIQQAAQTLRFDIEDSLAVDADNIAVSYQEKPTLTSTVDMIVYTASRSVLTEIFEMMEQEGSDPLAAMPVSAAWQYYLLNAGCTGQSAIYLGRSAGDLQLMVLNDNGQPVTCRKFPISGDQTFYETLKLELNRCCLTALTGMVVEKLYYHSDGISLTLVSDMASDLGLELEALPQESFVRAAATGAALAIQKDTPACNFRADDMEPVSIKKDRFKAKLVMSALVCAFLCSWIFWNAVYTVRYNSLVEDSAKNIAAAADACRVSTRSAAKIPVDIERKLMSFKQMLSGTGTLNSESAVNTFNLTLNALSRLNNEFDLVVSSMTFKPEEVKPFSGSVADLEALEELRRVLTDDKSGLAIIQETSNNTGERQSFEMPLAPGRKK